VGEPIVVTADGPRPAAITSLVRDQMETMLNIRPPCDPETAGAEAISAAPVLDA
jgi:hypothetical protein